MSARKIMWRVAQRLYPGCGCTDGGCVFGDAGGMHTNGGCGCLKERDAYVLKGTISKLSNIARVLAAFVPDESPDARAFIASDAQCERCPNGCDQGERLCRICERGGP